MQDHILSRRGLKRWPPQFFNGLSNCYCCQPHYWIRKYSNLQTMPVVAQVEAYPRTDTVDTSYDYFVNRMICRGNHVCVNTHWVMKDASHKEVFVRYDKDLSFINAFQVTVSDSLQLMDWDSNGSEIAVVTKTAIYFYNSSGTLVYTVTPPSGEAPQRCALDSTGALYFTTFKKATTFPYIDQRFLYKYSALGVLQWKNSTTSTDESLLACGDDDYVWIYRASIQLMERRSGTGALTSATVACGTQYAFQGFGDGSSGLWIVQTDTTTAFVSHATSLLNRDKRWQVRIGEPVVPNIAYAFNGTSQVIAQFFYDERTYSYSASGSLDWQRLRSETPNYWGGNGRSKYPWHYVTSAGFMDGYIYFAGTETPP